ncbi:MAG: outer membrane protein transport protein [Nitrospiraceae bacterium]|nr:MAG: outer membrane protein transport protein [Nitrospiraceae bacterium]
MRVILLILLIPALAPHAWSSGFALYNHSSASIAQGGAVIAHNDDSSALFFNPALMNKLEQPQVKLGINYLRSSVEFKSDATGKTFNLKDTSHYIPTVFAIHRINDSISAGLVVFSHFGLSTTWDDEWEGRYLATHSELKTITVNPAVSFMLLPQVFVAGGVSISILDAELNKNITLSPMLPDIRQKLTGDDVAVGYNAGLLVDITEDVSFGISYRSSMKAEFQGEVEHQIPQAIPSNFASMFPDTSASTTVNLPPQAFAGIAYSGIESFVFEVSVKWEGWSKYDELRILLDEPIVTETAIVIPRNWEDVYPVSFGAQYRVNDMFDINAGYTYDPTPVPDDTFEPSVPESDGHIFSLGTDIRFRNVEGGLLYAYKKYIDREKNNMLDDNPTDGIVNPLTSVNGTYKNSINMFGIDVAYVF